VDRGVSRRQRGGSPTVVILSFLDRNSSYTAPLINGLSDHDAQFLTISDINTDINLAPLNYRLRKINNETIVQFQRLLANETWEQVFKNWDTIYKFNSFLDTCLKIFEASFLIQNKSLGNTRNNWTTQRMKITCRHKKSLYVLNRRRNSPHMRAHYNKYCKTLSGIITQAKRQHYFRLIEKADNKIKTTWNIIKHKSGKLQQMVQISPWHFIK
jgi:hypothetical protein